MKAPLLLLSLALAFPLLGHTNDTLLYRIFDVATQEEITVEQLVLDVSKTDVVFFGEEHNDSVAHTLQYQVLRRMDDLYPSVALSMEMFATSEQLVLDEYLAGLVTDRNLASDVNLWNNYDDYRPLVEYARENGIRVIAANAPRRYTNRVTRLGLTSLTDLPHQSQALLAPLPIDTLTGRYYEKFVGLMGGQEHMGTMKIYQSQNLWDATMAYRIHGFLLNFPDTKILHLNGKFHSDEKLGTIAQLKKYAPHLTISNISCFPHESFNNPTWSAFTHLGDYIIITNPNIPKTF